MTSKLARLFLEFSRPISLSFLKVKFDILPPVPSNVDLMKFVFLYVHYL